MIRRRNAVLELVLLGSLVAGTAACQTDDGGRLASELEPMIEQLFALDFAPGMAVAVVQGSELAYAKGFGYADLETQRPVTPQTLFYIASTTKAFTAFAAALLHHRGELDLDVGFSRYLPNARLTPPFSADDITLRDLLTHTHGLSGRGPVDFRTAFTGVHTNEQLVELLSVHQPASMGREFQYGNIGYNVAGLAMDAALDVGWKELLDREIFEPLGMSSTTAYMSSADRDRLAMAHGAEPEGFRRVYDAKNDGNMHAAGGHLTTVLDLANWLEAHINGGRVDGRQVFPDEVVAETHRKQVDQDRNFSTYHRHGWGLGWDLGTYEGDTLIHRFGSFFGAFRSHMSFMPQHDIGVIVLVNEGRLGSFLADAVANYVYDRLLEKPVDEQELLESARQRVAQMRESLAQGRARRASRSQTLPHPLSAYAGVYENSELGRMEWQVVDEKLEVTMGLLWSAVEVYDGEQNQLRVELIGGGQVIAFSVAGDRAERLIYMGREFPRVPGS